MGFDLRSSRTELMSEPQLIAWAGSYAASLAGRCGIVALEGALGSGKTTVARAIIQALAGKQTNVPSPTFALMIPYEFRLGDGTKQLIHADFYRLGSAEESLDLGIEEAAMDSLVLVEWFSRAAELFAKSSATQAFSTKPFLTISMEIEPLKNKRRAILTAH